MRHGCFRRLFQRASGSGTAVPADRPKRLTSRPRGLHRSCSRRGWGAWWNGTPDHRWSEAPADPWRQPGVLLVGLQQPTYTAVQSPVLHLVHTCVHNQQAFRATITGICGPHVTPRRHSVRATRRSPTAWRSRSRAGAARTSGASGRSRDWTSRTRTSVASSTPCALATRRHGAGTTSP